MTFAAASGLNLTAPPAAKKKDKKFFGRGLRMHNISLTIN